MQRCRAGFAQLPRAENIAGFAVPADWAPAECSLPPCRRFPCVQFQDRAEISLRLSKGTPGTMPSRVPPLCLSEAAQTSRLDPSFVCGKGGILPFLLEAPRPSASAKGKWDATRDLASVGAELRKPEEVAPLEAAAGGERQGWEIGGVGWEGADASPAR